MVSFAWAAHAPPANRQVTQSQSLKNLKTNHQQLDGYENKKQSGAYTYA